MLFFQVKPAAEVRRILGAPGAACEAVDLPLDQALGRVLARDLASLESLPPYSRAAVDGYAVRAAETFGASASLPAYLQVTGEVRMGEPAAPLDAGCMRVATGGMIPAGADAVVMLEQTGPAGEEAVEIFRPAAPGDGVIREGDDLRVGEVLLPKGRRLRPQEIGLLAALGIDPVPVFDLPHVPILSTGDELVPHGVAPPPGAIRDANAPALAAAVQAAGARPLACGILPDDPELLSRAVQEAVAQGPLVLLSGGSSVGDRDWTLGVLRDLPGAELLVHGVAIRPGKPLIVVRVPGCLVVGLPGNPISALVVFQQFIEPYLRGLCGEAPVRRPPPVSACLAAAVSSDPGKEDFIRVRLRQTAAGLVADPILAPSSLLRSLVIADGLLRIPAGVEGCEAGVQVEIELC